jgi:Sigma-70, region 4
MDELRRFCVRMLGDGPAADAAVAQARSVGQGDRLGTLIGALRACRERQAPAADADGETNPPRQVDGAGAPTEAPAAPAPGGLAGAVARELQAATARLPGPQREALALRELLGLPYDELAQVMSVDPEALPTVLARARIRLRAELRGSPEPSPDCPEHERALRTIALRQDGQPVSAGDDDWLMEHLGHCRACGRAHAAMLEASACYRAWNGE